MAPKLSPRTMLLVSKIFNAEKFEEAVQQLENECGNNIPFCSNDDEYQMERIRFAAIKLSSGDIKKLREAINEARMDWRDLFMAAGFGYDVKAHEKWAEEILK
jgi:hypothetical protein